MSLASRTTLFGLALFLVVAVVGCSADSSIADNVANAVPAALDPTSVPETTTPAVPADEASADDTDTEQEACELVTSDVDMWAGLDGPAIELARQRTNLLLDSNPETCAAFEQIDSPLDAAELGALAVRSVEHVDPYVRYDIFVFESRQIADDLGARDVARAAVEQVVPADSAVEVFRVGDSLFVAESYNDDGSGRTPREVRGILTYYGELISGLE